MRRLLTITAALAALAGLAAPAGAAPGLGVRVQPDGCLALVDGDLLAPRDPAAPACQRVRDTIALRPRAGLALVWRNGKATVVRRDPASGAYHRVGGPQACLAGLECLPVRGTATLPVATTGSGTVVLGAPQTAAVATVVVAADGTMTQAPGTGGCVAWLHVDGCADARAVPGGSVGRGTVAASSDAVYVLVQTAAGWRVDVLALASDGALTPQAGAAACVSQDGTDGAGGACLAMPEVDYAQSVVAMGSHLAVVGIRITDTCTQSLHLCASVVVLDRAAGSGLLSRGPGRRCIGLSAGCMVPRNGLGGAGETTASDDGLDLFVGYSTGSRSDRFRVDAATGDLVQGVGPSGCISFAGEGGCLRGPSPITASGRYAVAAGGIATFDRDPATGELTANSGVDACVIGLPPCRQADVRRGVQLGPDGIGFVDVEHVGVVAFEPQSAPTCAPVELVAFSAGTTSATPCSDPNGDAITYAVTAQPLGGGLGGGASLTYGPGDDRTGRSTGTFSATDGGRTVTATASVRAVAAPQPRVTKIVGGQPLGRRRGLRLFGAFWPGQFTVRGSAHDEGGRPLRRRDVTFSVGGVLGGAKTSRRGFFAAEFGAFPESSHPTSSGELLGHLDDYPGRLRPTGFALLLSPRPDFESFYTIVGDEFRLRGVLAPAAASREGTLRSERRAGRRWVPLARMPVTPGGRFVLRTPGAGDYRIIWIPRRGRTRFAPFVWGMRLLPPRAPQGRGAIASMGRVQATGGRVLSRG